MNLIRYWNKQLNLVFSILKYIRLTHMFEKNEYIDSTSSCLEFRLTELREVISKRIEYHSQNQYLKKYYNPLFKSCIQNEDDVFCLIHNKQYPSFSFCFICTDYKEKTREVSIKHV